MPSRTLSVIFLSDYNIGSEGIEQVIELATTQTLVSIQPRTLYRITSVATDITITLPTAGTAGAYAFFASNRTGAGNAIISTASLISGATTQTISVDKEGIGIEDTGSTYSITRDTRVDRFVTKTTAQTITGAKTFSGVTIVPTGTASTHAVNKSQMDAADALKANLSGNNTFVAGVQSYNGVKTFYVYAVNFNTDTLLLSGISLAKVEASFHNRTDDNSGAFISHGMDSKTPDFADLVKDTGGLTLGYTSSGSDINLYWDGGDLRIQSASTSADNWSLKITFY